MMTTRTRKRALEVVAPHASQEEERVMHRPTSFEESLGPDTQSISSEDKEKKKTRGNTYCAKVWGMNPDVKLPVECNEYGQPVDDNSTTFGRFMGVLVRRHTYAPIDILDWRHMPRTKKKDLLEVMKDKFDCPPGIDEFILQSMGIKWRNFKKNLRKKYFDPTLPLEDLIKRRDERVNEVQWRKLLNYWLSEDGKKASMRGKESRKYKTLNHKTGSKSFAQIRIEQGRDLGRTPTRVESYKKCYCVEQGGEPGKMLDIMQELTNELEDPSHDRLARDDVFARTIGADKPGRVRMIGHGVSPSDVFEEYPSRKTCYRMLKESMAQVEVLNEKFETLKLKLVGQESNNGVSSPIVSSSPPSYSPAHVISTSTSTAIQRPLRINSSVVLLSIFDQKKIVAKGYLRYMEPTSWLENEELGEDWYGVHINVAVDRNARLLRSGELFKTIGEAQGMTIAWPYHLVIRADEDN